jgi:hypothetical protein
MTEAHAPASYRGSQTAQQFLREVGNVWIGLLEKISERQDLETALGEYFDVSPNLIRNWIDARGRTRCVATLPEGRRCAVLIGQQIDYDPNAWAAQNRRCPAHGG